MSGVPPKSDLQQIHELKARYFRLMDTKQWDEWQKLFTDDVVAIVDMEVSTHGRPGNPLPARRGSLEFMTSTRDMIHQCTTVHQGHMPEIEILSDTAARGIWAMEDIVEFPDGRMVNGHGHYHEEYRKEDGAWRIASLHLTRIRVKRFGISDDDLRKGGAQ